MAKRGCFGVRWVMVVCLLQGFQALGLDCAVSSNSPGGLLFCRWPGYQKLPGVLGLGAGGVQKLIHFFWFLGSIRHGDWQWKASNGGQRNGWNGPRRTLELHVATTNLSVCTQNAVFFKKRWNASTIPQIIHLQLEHVTHRLTLPRYITIYINRFEIIHPQTTICRTYTPRNGPWGTQFREFVG